MTTQVRPHLFQEARKAAAKEWHWSETGLEDSRSKDKYKGAVWFMKYNVKGNLHSITGGKFE
jgi:hypothetical protein